MQWGVVVQCMWAAGSTQTPPPASAAFRNDPGSPSSESFTVFVQIIHVRKKIADYRHSVVEPVATEAVDRRFRAVIEQFQPKQRRAIKDDRRNRQHADLVATDHGERNRCSRTILGNGAESDVSSCNSQFGQRPPGRVAIFQSSRLLTTPCECAARTSAASANASTQITSDAASGV